jgi:hypothetical protein
MCESKPAQKNNCNDCDNEHQPQLTCPEQNNNSPTGVTVCYTSRERPSSQILLATVIKRAWVNIKENIRTLAKESQDMYELKQLKPWCDECLGFVDQRKQANM